MKRSRSLAVVIVLLLSLAGTPAAVSGASVVCTVNNGTVNGSDSGLNGFPGSDNPDGVDGSYSVSGSRHDSTEYEYCEPSHDWFDETRMMWNSTAVTKLRNEAGTHTIQVEQNVLPETSYNYTGGHSSNLPYSFIYVADVGQQASQGFEEVSYVVMDPSLIVANVDYYGYLQWQQEADGTFGGSFKPLLNRVDIKIEYGNKSLFVQNFDLIGRWQKKIANNK
jgi:hypothetical protein